MSSEREWVSSGAGWVSSARLHTSICVLVQSDTGGHQSWSQRPEKPIKRSRWRRGLVWVAVDRAEAAKRTLIAASAATAQVESRALPGVRRSGMLGGAHGHERAGAWDSRCSSVGERVHCH